MRYLYLDQRDLIDLARDQSNVRDRLKSLIDRGEARVVLSFMHAIETWKHKDKGHRKSVAQLADSLKPIWLLNRNYLFEEEARVAIWELRGGKIEVLWSPEDWAKNSPPAGNCVSDQSEYRFCPYRLSPLEAFADSRHSKPSGQPNRSFGLCSLVEAFDDAPEIPAALIKLHEAYAESQPVARSTTKLPRAESFIYYVFDRAIRDLNFSDSVQQLVSTIKIRRCPALNTYLKIRAAIHKDATARPAPSEMVDVIHVVALPYVDAFSSDKRIVDYIRRSKMQADVFVDQSVRAMKPFRLLGAAMDWLEGGESNSTEPVASPG